MTRILVVDDEQQLLRALRINLTARRYEVLTAPDGATALQAWTRYTGSPTASRCSPPRCSSDWPPGFSAASD